jgi:multidrug efflux pump subunit AcrA (membrane-fusion protein)
MMLVAILAIPVHYKIRCDCEMEAVARRFVAAPFDGKLEKALVSPGQPVARGDVLARMSGRQNRLELAELTAERGRVAKQRDVAMAAYDVAAAQLAKLDMERLDLNLKMLQRRAEQLEITSPIDGFVISGDHEKLEGAPLATGQTLFEVAPMEQMVAEVAIPEDEVSFVQTNMDVIIQLDAFPRRVWRGRIASVHPRSENIDNENVFIAEVVLGNPDALLQPGMKGRAKTIAGRRFLAWNLFHKSCDYVARMLGS